MTSFVPLFNFVGNYTPGGNISPSRFLTVHTTSPNVCLQASASTAIIIGISGKDTRYPPGSPADDGYHRTTADNDVTIHGPGQRCSLKLGVTAVTDLSVPLTSDASGQGIPQAPANATTCWYGALPLELGAAGDTIEVLVLPPTPTV